MDDGNSWIGILLFAASVAVFYLIYGFGAAIQELNTRTSGTREIKRRRLF